MLASFLQGAWDNEWVSASVDEVRDGKGSV